MATTAELAFPLTAPTYDQDRARLIPCFGRFYARAVELIPAGAKTLLDLGAGTGLLSAFVRARLPYARLHLMDISGAMLDQARHRFDGDERVTFEVADYAEAELPGALCAVVSALSIHHLDDEAKRLLFKRIHAALKPGGVFVNAEQVLGPTASVEARYRSEWLDRVRQLGASDRQIEESLFRQQADRCAPVEDQLAWLREAGFADADCWFKDGRFAVMAGTKR
jgi:tRNA (cmo5U34)-methyltransferase